MGKLIRMNGAGGQLPRVEIYTDGALFPGDGRAGAGALLCHHSHTEVMQSRIKVHGNHLAEIAAAALSLELLDRASDVTLYSDCLGMVDYMSGRAHFRKGHDWITRLDTAAARHRVRWVWVKGHADSALQHAAHHAAQMGAMMEGVGAIQVSRLGMTLAA